jgi:hypothetical protein
MNFFEQNRTGQNESPTPAYTLLNAKIGTSISVGKQDMEYLLSVTILPTRFILTIYQLPNPWVST